MFLIFLQINRLPVGLYVQEPGESLEEVHLRERFFEHCRVATEGETEAQCPLVGEDCGELGVKCLVIG